MEKARDFVLVQHDRRLARLLHGRQTADEIGPFERDLEEEPQRGNGGVYGRRADLLLRRMQLKAAQVLAGGRLRRPAEESREGLDMPNVVLPGRFTEAARRHVVDHALAQWVDGLVGHRESSCLAWG